MWRTGKVKSFIILSEHIRIPGQAGLTDLKSVPKICLKHPNQKKTVTYKGY